MMILAGIFILTVGILIGLLIYHIGQHYTSFRQFLCLHNFEDWEESQDHIMPGDRYLTRKCSLCGYTETREYYND